ncbi:DUF5817 domain-containing protein [Halovenus rubra]|uniref:DUF5817 domain-containing protein n=2 Tax=Halovenus rubra TaxID=869890 RepID=A0ABD5X660_9EURY|nr:DUF5817 domain-containing protein [Halovenus rubra]
MYAVVGCDACSALWIVDGEPETSQCPRCGKTRGHHKRRKFITTDDEDHAREVRSSMLASRQGHSDAFAELDSFAELDAVVEESGIDDETYLRESGLNVSEVQEAAEDDSTSTSSPKAIIREALETLPEPTTETITAYASERGVPAADTEQLLEKLRRSGEVTKNNEQYRLL